MLQKIVLAFAIAVLPALIVSPVQGQTMPAMVAGSGDASSNRHSTLRVQTQMNLFLAGAVAESVDEQKAASSNARRAIYEMANRECQILIDVFRADCRLVSINVNSNVRGRIPSQGNDGINASGTASFELAVRPN